MIAIAIAAPGSACGSVTTTTVVGGGAAIVTAITSQAATVIATGTWSSAAGWYATTMIDRRGRDRVPPPSFSRARVRCRGSAYGTRCSRGALPDLIEQCHRGIDAVSHRLCAVADDAEPCFAAAQEEACAASRFTDAAMVPATVVLVVVAATLGAVLPTVAPPRSAPRQGSPLSQDAAVRPLFEFRRGDRGQ
jgi:hypothetical protein